jgi:hypothetical protein
MSVSLRIEGPADIDVRDWAEHITAEAWRDGVVERAALGTPAADLGSSFPDRGWGEWFEGRHEDHEPARGERFEGRHEDHEPARGERFEDRHEDHDHGPGQRSQGVGHERAGGADGHAGSQFHAEHVHAEHGDVGGPSAAGHAIPFGRGAGVEGERGVHTAGGDHHGYAVGTPAYALSAGVRGPGEEHHSLSAQPAGLAPLPAGVFSAGPSILPDGMSRGLSPAFSSALSRPVNPAIQVANTAVVTTSSVVSSQPVATTPVSSAAGSHPTSQPLTATVEHFSTGRSSGVAPGADLGGSASHPADATPGMATAGRSAQQGTGSGTAASGSSTGASGTQHPGGLSAHVTASGAQPPAADWGSTVPNDSGAHHGGNVGVWGGSAAGSSPESTGGAAAGLTTHPAGSQPMTGPATSSGASSGTTVGGAHSSASGPANTTSSGIRPGAGAEAGAHPASPAQAGSAPAPAHPAAPTTPAPSPITTNGSAYDTGSSLPSHPASTGTVATADSAHPGLSSAPHGLSSGLAPSTAAPGLSADHPADHTAAPIHH